jgi:hypothetical protein
MDQAAAQVRLEALDLAADGIRGYPAPPRSLSKATRPDDLDEQKDLIEIERRIASISGFHSSHCAA